MNIHVFLGPTLPQDEARKLLDAQYHPPVELGDVCRLALQDVAIIGIIDGVFEQTPTVWHKEILFALSRGVRVLGAASMGAIRAAELAAFGMEGVGRIFDAIHSGEIEDDDEVAVEHGPAELGYRPVSEAMVNLRLGLRRAATLGLISEQSAFRLEEAARQTWYTERSWPQLLNHGKTLGVPAMELDALRTFVREERPDAKGDDARALLSRIAQLKQEGCIPHVPQFSFEPTYNWEKLLSIVKRESFEETVEARLGQPLARLWHQARARWGTDLDQEVLRLLLMEQRAIRMGLAPDEEGKKAARASLARDLGLGKPEELEVWGKGQALQDDELSRLLDLHWLEGELQRSLRDEAMPLRLLALQRRGLLSKVLDPES